jgi:thiamine biosynthesis lipoprotein
VSAAYEQVFAAMGTVVAVRVVHDGSEAAARDAVARAGAWFDDVERACSRFDAASELRQLCAAPTQTPVAVSPILAQAVAFAVDVAKGTNGAFDPTVGATMERRGFDSDYRTGARGASGVAEAATTWRDVHVDPEAGTITLDRALLLDLGGVAKGLAIDLAARELAGFAGFAIDAGGDLRVAGVNASGAPWTIGVRNPRELAQHAVVLTATDVAVCTSGDYERRDALGGHHLIDPRTGEPAADVASATVVAPTAIVADALATAAFTLGPQAGIALLESHGVEGLIIDASLAFHETPGFGALIR